MKGIKEFLAQFVQTEKALEEAFRREDFETHSKLVAELNAMSFDASELVLASEIKLPLSRIKKQKLDQEKTNLVFERRIYKITKCKNLKYTEIWLAYVSLANPEGEVVKLLSNCYCVAKIDEEFKFLSEYFADYDTKAWKFGGGDRDLHDFYQLGTPVSVERLESPTIDAWSIEEYNKNS
jgi:hypothetical protein